MRRVLLGMLRVVGSIVATVLSVGCVVVILATIMFVFLWLLLR